MKTIIFRRSGGAGSTIGIKGTENESFTEKILNGGNVDSFASNCRSFTGCLEGKTMKVRESGMPEVEIWNTFFKPETILNELKLTGDIFDAADFGCGYGTFTIPASKRIHGTLHSFDIDLEMIRTNERLVEQDNVCNVSLHLRDFVTDGTALKAASVDYVMLFNILHTKNPVSMLLEAWRILTPGGCAGVIHWNYDPETPRGPPMAIRPRPADCRQWIKDAGFAIEKEHIDLQPYHYGILARKKTV